MNGERNGLLMDIFNRDEGTHLGYKQMLFPDGQPHITLDEPISGANIEVSARLKSPLDIMELLLLKDILDQGDNNVDLFVLYLTGARMDRRIDERQPFTLQVVADLIRNAGFNNIGVLDPHSEVATDLLDARAAYPIAQVRAILGTPRFAESTVVVVPDNGAISRVEILMRACESSLPVVQGLKHRDVQTGALSGFSVVDPTPLPGKRALILDDICDGGGTFTGLAVKLREAGAAQVDLFVTHGIFSKGRRLAGIDHIYSTDSYFAWGSAPGFTEIPVLVAQYPESTERGRSLELDRIGSGWTPSVPISVEEMLRER